MSTQPNVNERVERALLDRLKKQLTAPLRGVRLDHKQAEEVREYILDSIRRHSDPGPTKTGPLFLVVSYNQDEQQWFYDYVRAKSADDARTFVMTLREDYLLDADATPVEMFPRWTKEAEDGAHYDIIADARVAECQDCSHRWHVPSLDVIEDYQQRVEPGEEAPAGQCPECGALASLVDS